MKQHQKKSFLYNAAFILTAVFVSMNHTSAANAAEIAILDNQIFGCSKIRVSFQDMPLTATAKGNWLAVADEGAPRSVVTFRQKYLPIATRGVVEISTLGLIPFKPYELRAYLDWEGTRSYDIAAVVQFSVLPAPNCQPAFISRVPSVVRAGESVEVGFENVQLSDSNWIALAAPGDVAWRFVKHTYLPRAKSGSARIDTTGLAPGEYQVRLFQKWKENKDYYIYDSVNIRID